MKQTRFVYILHSIPHSPPPKRKSARKAATTSWSRDILGGNFHGRALDELFCKSHGKSCFLIFLSFMDLFIYKSSWGISQNSRSKRGGLAVVNWRPVEARRTRWVPVAVERSSAGNFKFTESTFKQKSRNLSRWEVRVNSRS